MNFFDNSQENLEWAIENGVVKNCSDCGCLHDPFISCPNAKPRIFDNVVWPEETN